MRLPCWLRCSCDGMHVVAVVRSAESSSNGRTLRVTYAEAREAIEVILNRGAA